VFQARYHDHHHLNTSSDEDKNKELNRWGRKQELEADRDAADMHRSVGIATKTDDDSTHPVYGDRLAAMDKHYQEIEASPSAPQPGPGG